MDVGNRIKELASKSNISVSKLGSLAGISQPVMSRLANNSNKIPDIPTIEKICDALNITLKEFFDDGSEPITLTPELMQLIDNAKNLPTDVVESVNNMLEKLTSNYKLVEKNIDGKDVQYLVDLNVKPNGLTQEEELEAQRLIKRLNELKKEKNIEP